MEIKVEIEIVQGVEGPAVYINRHRVFGPKPYAGAGSLHRFTCDLSSILTALSLESPPPPPSSDIPTDSSTSELKSTILRYESAFDSIARLANSYDLRYCEASSMVPDSECLYEKGRYRAGLEILDAIRASGYVPNDIYDPDDPDI